ncbi:hypothetical protein HO173_012214 [Letharia columbiana]|uniref:Uncharacterized protein n=1 Tax=Letharia columbiana TaxID=112416 RepID=A0A8H6CQ67_9LECA|nr:uncharacterized protein HO173_012214 [Letharia columbiana]KAF6227575.1 hypothetical protein HO173_012214 [Letharia columbiana]
MPAFHDTWLSPNISIPPISTGADHNHHDRSTSGLQICRLCSDGFHTENNLSHTRARSPCADLSCTGCTWLWRNGDAACHKCVARFTCPSQEQESSSSGVDGLPNSSYRVLVPDEAYEGDDERGVFSKVGNVPSASPRLSMRKKERWAQRNRDFFFVSDKQRLGDLDTTSGKARKRPLRLRRSCGREALSQRAENTWHDGVYGDVAG